MSIGIRIGQKIQKLLLLSSFAIIDVPFSKTIGSFSSMKLSIDSFLLKKKHLLNTFSVSFLEGSRLSRFRRHYEASLWYFEFQTKLSPFGSILFQTFSFLEGITCFPLNIAKVLVETCVVLVFFSFKNV